MNLDAILTAAPGASGQAASGTAGAPASGDLFAALLGSAGEAGETGDGAAQGGETGDSGLPARLWSLVAMAASSALGSTAAAGEPAGGPWPATAAGGPAAAAADLRGADAAISVEDALAAVADQLDGVEGLLGEEGEVAGASAPAAASAPGTAGVASTAATGGAMLAAELLAAVQAGADGGPAGTPPGQASAAAVDASAGAADTAPAEATTDGGASSGAQAASAAPGATGSGTAVPVAPNAAGPEVTAPPSSATPQPPGVGVDGADAQGTLADDLAPPSAPDSRGGSGVDLDPNVDGPSAAGGTNAASRLAASRGADTTERPGASTLARVLDAVEQLEDAPPPRHMVIDVDGMRLRVSLAGDAVRIDPSAGSRLSQAWREDISDALAERGFEMADDSDRSGRQRDETPDRPFRPRRTTTARGDESRGVQL